MAVPRVLKGGMHMETKPNAAAVAAAIVVPIAVATPITIYVVRAPLGDLKEIFNKVADAFCRWLVASK